MNNLNIMNELPRLEKYKLSFISTTKIFWRLFTKSLTNNLKTNLNPMRKISIGVSVVAVLAVLAGTSAYAYNATKVTYGSILYPAKRGVEAVKISLANQGLPKVNAYLDQAGRRMEEAKYLIENNKNINPNPLTLISTAHAADGDLTEDNLSKTLADAETSTNQASEETNSISETTLAAAAVDALQAAQNAQETILTDLAAQVDLKNETITNHIAKALEVTNKRHDRLQKAKDKVEELKAKLDEKVKEEIIDQSETEDNNDEVKNLTLEEVTVLFETYKASKATMLTSLVDIPAEKTTKLLERLSNREAKIQEAIDNGNFQQANGLIRAAMALQNNAKHFLKETKREELKNEAEQKREDLKNEAEQKREDLKNEAEQKREELKSDRETKKEEIKKSTNTNEAEDSEDGEDETNEDIEGDR